MRYVAQEIKAGWIVYDSKLMRPLSVTVYFTKQQAEAKAAEFN